MTHDVVRLFSSTFIDFALSVAVGTFYIVLIVQCNYQ